MWRMVKAEFIYNKGRILFAFLFIIAFSILFIKDSPTSSIFPVLYIPFMILNQIIVFWNKEKRIRSHVLLPVTIRQIAAVRILLIVIPYFCINKIFLIIYNIFTPHWHFYYGQLIYILSVVFIFYSVYFILQDIFLKKGTNPVRMIIYIVFSVVGLGAILGIYLIAAGIPQPLADTFKFLSKHNPFSIKYWAVSFLVMGLLSCFLTLVTYTRRKSFLE